MIFQIDPDKNTVLGIDKALAKWFWLGALRQR